MSKQDYKSMGTHELTVIDKAGDAIVLIADMEDNQNVPDLRGDGDPRAWRYSIYGLYGGDWQLDNGIVLSPGESAISEICGRNAGGICYGYEDDSEWGSYPDAYEAMYDNYSAANEQVAVLDDPSELYELADGMWFVSMSGSGKYI